MMVHGARRRAVYFLQGGDYAHRKGLNVSRDLHQNIPTMEVSPAMLMAASNHLKWHMLGHGCGKLFKSVAALL